MHSLIYSPNKRTNVKYTRKAKCSNVSTFYHCCTCLSPWCIFHAATVQPEHTLFVAVQLIPQKYWRYSGGVSVSGASRRIYVSLGVEGGQLTKCVGRTTYMLRNALGYSSRRNLPIKRLELTFQT